MNYFDQLLESYSRLKQRKLVLLEKEEKKKEKPDKIVQEYTPEQVLTAALGTPVADKPVPIPGLITRDKEGNEKEATGYQKAPGEGAMHGEVIASNATKGANNATVVNADGTPREPQFTTWFERNFAGKEALEQTDGTGLEAALNRVGESLGPILSDSGVDDSLQATIFAQVRNMVGLASDLVISARDKGVKQPWAGWKAGEEKGTGRYVGRGEDNSDDPEMTRSVGSYISGRSSKSIEFQIAHGKTVEFAEDTGAVFDTLAKDPMLIEGALDSVQAFMELGKAEVADRETKCAQIGKRVKSKGDRLVFFRNEDPNQGIAIKRSELFKFVESQIEESCPKGIQAIPQGEYTPQQLNDMRGKGMEQGSIAVGILPNIQDLPDGELKSRLSSTMGKLLRKELLKDEKKFSAAYKQLQESKPGDVALSLRASFVVDAMEQLRLETDTPEKARAFLQRSFDMEAPVVAAIGSKFTFPVGKKTGLGYADDLEYTFLDENSANNAAKTMKLQGDAVHSVKVSDLLKEHGELGSVFKDLYSLSDDDSVYLVGSGQKSYFKDGSLKFGETTQRSDAVMGTAENIAPGFEKVTMQRLGINEVQLAELREYQTELDKLDSTLDSILPDEVTVSVDSDNNQNPINFETVTTMVLDYANKLSLDSDIRSKLTAIVQDYQGTITDLNGPDNSVQRSELKNELSRVLTASKQLSDMNNMDDPALAMRARRNLAYAIHMTGGVLRDGILNKKVYDDNTVRAGSHMSPLMDATKGLLNMAPGHKVKGSKGMMSINLIGPNGEAITYGAERTRTTGGKAVTRNTVDVNIKAQTQKNGVGLEEKIDITDPVKDSLMISFLKGQQELLETLLANE